MKATGTGRLYLGNHLSYNHYNNPYPGRIDEVRISNVARSADWVNATYDTVHNDDFATYRVPNDWGKYSHTFSVSFPGATNGVLSSFPVLVKVSESSIPGFRYADCLKENGGDLRFSDADGNLLDSEVDTWNTADESLVWVNIPSFASNSVIKAYYGWDFAPNVESMNVWTNGYLGVWHLDEDTSPLKDATGGGKSWTRDAKHVDMVSLGGAGIVGNAPEFAMKSETSGSETVYNGYLSLKDNGNKFSGKRMTVEMWAYQREDKATNRRLLYKKDKDLAFDFNLQYSSKSSQSTLTFSFVQTNMQEEVSMVTNSVRARYQGEGVNVWRHYAAVYDSVDAQSLLVYVNGANSGSSDDSVAVNQGYSIVPSGGSVYLGNLSSKRAFPGKIDEVRISSVARSAGWLRTTYDMIKGNAAFATYSAVREQVKGLTIIIR